MTLGKIRKRDKRIVPFELEKITEGIFRAAQSTGGFKQDMDLIPSSFRSRIYGPYLDLDERQIAQKLALRAADYLTVLFEGERIPNVELTQGVIETTLKQEGFIDIWETYRLYRWGRTAVRESLISEKQFKESGLPDENVLK